jgi:alanine racemase
LDGRVPGIRRRALIDVHAFRSQLSAEPLDARADAFGHGLALLAPVAREVGVPEIVVSDERDAAVARASGFSHSQVRVDRGGARADASPYGFDGIPVMSVVGEVIALKRVAAGAGVSYGYTYRAPTARTLALVGLGYADGIPRLAPNRARVRVGALEHPLVGRIAMDQFVLDVGDTSLELGMDATLFGEPGDFPTAVQWAEWTERTPAAFTAGIAARVVRSAR